MSDADSAEIDAIMTALGFSRAGKDFSHPKTKLFVEFPARNLVIGNASNVKPKGRLKVGSATLILYSPTQCVMDRLAAFYHWNDTKSLEQALMVASSQKINLREIEEWSNDEGESEKFKRFKIRYEQRNHNP